MEGTDSEEQRWPWLRIVSFAAGALAFFLAMRAIDAPGLLRQALAWIDGLGALGPVLFVIVYILVAVLFLPASVLTLGAGAVFGLVKGTILVSAGSTLGATAAFLVGRYLARDWVAKKTRGNERFRAIDQAVAKEGWKIVGLTRLSPAFPFALLNYAFGLTQVRLRDFVLASWIGMIPGTILYVYLGSLAGDLASAGGGGRQRTASEWALYGVGLLATIAVTVYVTRLARGALDRRAAA